MNGHKKINYFIEIVKAKSISRAARSLKIDQPILNRAVRSLEEEAGFKLYAHYDKTFKLTEKGLIAYKHYKKILEKVEEFKEEITNSKQKKKLQLNVLTSNGMANFFLIEALPLFLEDHKNIYFSFTTNDLIQEIDVSIDICIGPKIIGEDTENFYLFTYYLRLFASKEYLEKYGYPRDPADLDKHRLVSYSRKDISTFIDFDWHLRYGAANGVPRKPYLQVSSSYALKRAAERHLGIVTFSRMLVKRDNSSLVEIFPNEKGLRVDVYSQRSVKRIHSSELTREESQ